MASREDWGDWSKSETEDVLWGARRLVLSVIDGVEDIMDLIDPIGCYRDGVDRYGEPLERDNETFTLLEFLSLWRGKLRRANSAMREVSLRMRHGEGGAADGREEAAAALPDSR